MEGNMQGSVVVTGASGGIGHALAERFVDHYSEKNTGIFTVRESQHAKAQSLNDMLSKAKGSALIKALDRQCPIFRGRDQQSSCNWLPCAHHGTCLKRRLHVKTHTATHGRWL